MHTAFYILHIIGASIILFGGFYLLVKNAVTAEQRKKISSYTMIAAHTQLLTGFILFFLMLSEVNHIKIGIKLLLAIEIATLATMYKKKIFTHGTSNKLILPSILLSTILVILIAFFM